MTKQFTSVTGRLYLESAMQKMQDALRTAVMLCAETQDVLGLASMNAYGEVVDEVLDHEECPCPDAETPPPETLSAEDVRMVWDKLSDEDKNEIAQDILDRAGLYVSETVNPNVHACLGCHTIISRRFQLCLDCMWKVSDDDRNVIGKEAQHVAAVHERLQRINLTA